MRGVDAHKERFGVEPICRVLTEHGIKIAPSTYYQRAVSPVSAAELADAYAANTLVDLYRKNRGVYGVRKLWHTARRAGHPWGRDQIGRLMAIAGIDGVRRGRHRTVTTQRDQTAPRHRTSAIGRGLHRPHRTSGGWRTSPTCGPWPGSSRSPSSPTSTPAASSAGGCRRRRRHRWSCPRWSRRCSPAAAATPPSTPPATAPLRCRGQAIHVSGVHRGADRSRHRRLHRLGRRHPGQRADGVDHRPLQDRTDRPAAAGRAQVERETAAWVHWFNTDRLHSAIDYRRRSSSKITTTVTPPPPRNLRWLAERPSDPGRFRPALPPLSVGTLRESCIYEMPFLNWRYGP